MVDRKRLMELIPWYLNGTLTGAELEAVENFVLHDPQGKAALAKYQRLRLLFRPEDLKHPPDGVEERLFDRIRSQSSEQLGILHPYALGLSMVILVLLWVIIRPGVILNWRVAGGEVTSFKVYRANADGSKLLMLDEVPAEEVMTQYSYVDLFAWPFKAYVYSVEGMNRSTSLGTSIVTTSPAMIALPGQVALICASFISGYGLILLIRYRKLLLIGNMRLSAV